MRATTLVFALVLSMSGSAAAQDWDQYTSTQDGFKVDFPGQPKVTQTTWKSEYGYMLPAHVYSVDKGREHYSMTVVDYNGIEQLGIERAAKCPPGAETCQGQRAGWPGQCHRSRVLDAGHTRRARLCVIQVHSTGRQGDGVPVELAGPR